MNYFHFCRGLSTRLLSWVYITYYQHTDAQFKILRLTKVARSSLLTILERSQNNWMEWRRILSACSLYKNFIVWVYRCTVYTKTTVGGYLSDFMRIWWQWDIKMQFFTVNSFKHVSPFVLYGYNQFFSSSSSPFFDLYLPFQLFIFIIRKVIGLT